MIKKAKKLTLLLLLTISLLACSTYKKITNTKKLNNYSYTLEKRITFNDEETKIIVEKGYVYNNIEKRITQTENKEFTTYYETKGDDTYMYTMKNNEYIKRKVPANTYSYLNLIDTKWVTYKNNKIELNENAHQKILKLLHIHKYKSDDIALEKIDYTDNGKYLTSIDATINLLKNKEIVGTATIRFTLDDVENITQIEIPYKQNK